MGSIHFTDAEIGALRGSFFDLIPVSESFAETFYTRLFSLHPEIRSYFKPDMQSQQDKLIDTFAVLLDVLVQMSDSSKILRELGARHVDYGATPELYESVRTIILSVLGEQAAMRDKPEVSATWTKLLDYVVAEMKAGAQHS